MKKIGLYFIVVVFCLPVTRLVAEEGTRKLFYGDVAHNFINRWGFQKICKHAFDHRRKNLRIKPEKVLPGDIVFTRRPDLFFKKIAPAIKNPYILVVHGRVGDKFRDRYIKYLNRPNVIAWFTIHPTELEHPKLFHLPLGVFTKPKVHKKIQGFGKKFPSLREMKKKYLLYMNLTKNTALRGKILKTYRTKPYCYTQRGRSFKDYLTDMAQSKFVLAPPGVGLDSFRAWESLLVGSIPIVISSPLNDIYEGLPVLIVDNYDDLTQEFLKEKYEEISSHTYPLDKLYISYWREKIKKVQRDFLEKYNQEKVI